MWMFGLLAAGLLQAASIAQAPLTPATAAILVNRSDDQYRPTLKQALADPDVAVRAVAARVAGVRHQGDMIPVLEGALAAEPDVIASTEQTRALRLIRHVSTGAPPADATPAHTAIRTIPQIVPGLPSSLLEAYRCKPAKRRAFGAARLTFDGDGVEPGVPPLERGRTLAMYGNSIVPPKKTRDVKPECPAGAQQNGVHGIVGVLARITVAGCIDFAALQA